MNTLRVEQVAKKLGIGVSTVWWFVKRNTGFPQPFKLSPQVIVWDEADVDEWLIKMKGEAQHETE